MVIHPVLSTRWLDAVFLFIYIKTHLNLSTYYIPVYWFFCFNSTLYISNVLDTFASQAGISKIAKSLKMKINWHCQRILLKLPCLIAGYIVTLNPVHFTCTSTCITNGFIIQANKPWYNYVSRILRVFGDSARGKNPVHVDIRHHENIPVFKWFHGGGGGGCWSYQLGMAVIPDQIFLHRSFSKLCTDLCIEIH